MSNRKVWLGDQLFLYGDVFNPTRTACVINGAMEEIQVYLNGVINGVKQSGEHWK